MPAGVLTLGALLRAWSLVYVGNIGAAALVFLAGQHGFGGSAVGKTALAIASTKAALPTIQLFFLAVLCNVLVCLAVWMSFGERSTTDKVMVIVPPIVAAGVRALDRHLFPARASTISRLVFHCPTRNRELIHQVLYVRARNTITSHQQPHDWVLEISPNVGSRLQATHCVMTLSVQLGLYVYDPWPACC